MQDEEKKVEIPQSLVLQITLDENGFKVVGEVVKNEPMALYMIEKAKDVIKAYHVKQNTPVIQKGGMMNFARRIFSK
jgi:hypothetical protein